MSGAFYSAAFYSGTFYTDSEPVPPPIVIDTHDGAIQTHVETKYRKPVDPFDRQGLLAEIKRAAGLIAEQEPEKADEIEAIEAEIRAEIQLPEINIMDLALAIDRMAVFANDLSDLYGDLYALSQKLYDEAEEEEAIVLLLM